MNDHLIFESRGDHGSGKNDGLDLIGLGPCAKMAPAGHGTIVVAIRQYQFVSVFGFGEQISKGDRMLRRALRVL